MQQGRGQAAFGTKLVVACLCNIGSIVLGDGRCSEWSASESESENDVDGEGFELPMLGSVDGEDLLEEEGVFGAVMTRPERKTWPSVTSAPLRS